MKPQISLWINLRFCNYAMKLATQSRAPTPTPWRCLDTSLLLIIPYRLSPVPTWSIKTSNCALWLIREVRCETSSLTYRWYIAEKFTPIRKIWVGILIGPLFKLRLTQPSRKTRLSSDANTVSTASVLRKLLSLTDLLFSFDVSLSSVTFRHWLPSCFAQSPCWHTRTSDCYRYSADRIPSA
jgi:hypothetical protein